MSAFAPIVRLARRLRLQAAEADLQFLEARAPIVIAEQRAHVAALRHGLGMQAVPELDTETIRREVERRAKRIAELT